LILKISGVWGICLKSYEKEAFLKSFSLLFLVQFIFLSLVMWQYHKSVDHKYDMKIMHEMTQCSYTLDCPKYEMDFVHDLKGQELNRLYGGSEYYMLFTIPTSNSDYLKFSLSKEKYEKEHEKIVYDNLVTYFLFLMITLLISGLFARFSLRPLNEALRLNDEFVKDMLHDFNTPLSSLKINFKILQKKFGEDDAINRSEEAMQTIASLQSNLSYFLSHSPLSQERVDLEEMVVARVKSYKSVFPDIDFLVDIPKRHLEINRESFLRVIDNLLSNACKYNVKDGNVYIFFKEDTLVIEDSGIGIKEPQKIFDRFYRETSRGMGIGLHVVKKLCDELDIQIEVESKLKKGTKFLINLEKVMLS